MNNMNAAQIDVICNIWKYQPFLPHRDWKIVDKELRLFPYVDDRENNRFE